MGLSVFCPTDQSLETDATWSDHRAGLRMGYLQFFPWKLFSSQPALPVLTLYEQLSLLFLHSSIPPSLSRLHKAVVHACQSQTQARQAPLSMEFSRQEYWSGLPFPFPGESSQPRDRAQVSHIKVDSLPLSHLGSPFSR